MGQEVLCCVVGVCRQAGRQIGQSAVRTTGMGLLMSTYTVANSDELVNVDGPSGDPWDRARRRRYRSQLRLRRHLERLLHWHRGHCLWHRCGLRLFGVVFLRTGHCLVELKCPGMHVWSSQVLTW